MLRNLLLILIVFAALTGCAPKVTNIAPTPLPVSTSTTPVTSPATKEPDTIVTPTSAARTKAAEAWKAAARLVAAKTGDPQAKLLTEFFCNNSRLAEPNPKGVRLIAKSTAEKHASVIAITPTFFLAPLLKGDEKVGPKWRAWATNPSFFASYNPGMMALILRATPTTKIWKGIDAHHEANHAYLDLQRDPNLPPQDAKAYSEEERDTHEMENREIAKLGGKAYERLLDREVARLKQVNEHHHQAIGDAFPGRASDYPELDRIFGKPLSEDERRFRATHVWVAACFALIDRYYSGDKETCKADFLEAMYRKEGIIKE